MRILFLSTWYPYPPDNGSKIRAYQLLRALGCSHQVTLVTFCSVKTNKNGVSRIFGPEALDVYAVPVDPFRYVNVPQVLKFTSPIPVSFWPSSLMNKTVAQVANSGRWDAVVAFQSPAARYALQLPELPRILDVDTALSYQLHQRYTQEAHPIARLRAWLSWQKAHRYESHLFRRFQACTVVWSGELDYVADMIGAIGCRVEISPNGVDCRHNSTDLGQPEPNTLVFNGALTYSANYDAMQYFLTEIYPLIQQQVPGLSLTITGSVSGVNLSGLPLDESIRLSGYVDDIRPWVASAWVCVVPIRRGGGTRLKILEAMALGTPVVATSKGAEGLDVILDQDILIADEPAEFAAQVVRLLQNPSLHQRLATNARHLVEEQYDWVQIGQRFVSLVEDVASKRTLGQISS